MLILSVCPSSMPAGMDTEYRFFSTRGLLVDPEASTTSISFVAPLAASLKVKYTSISCARPKPKRAKS